MKPSVNRPNPFLIIYLFVFFLFVQPLSIFAFDATLSWSPTGDPTLAGYKIYYGTASRAYGNPIDVGTQVAYTITGLGPGTYYFAVTAYNNLGMESGFSNETNKTMVDLTAPVITGILMNLTSTGAVITWNTDESATSEVEYGTTSSYGSTAAPDATLTTSHSTALSNLTPSTTYHYRVKSANASGSISISADNLFTTHAVAATTTPPPLIGQSGTAPLEMTPGNGGGCVMMTTFDGKAPGPKQAAEIPLLIGVVLFIFLKRIRSLFFLKFCQISKSSTARELPNPIG